MLVNRSKNQSGPAVMSIYFRQASSSDPAGSPVIAALQNTLPLAQQPHSSTENEFPAPEPAEDETVVKIDMKHVKSDAILTEFLAKTGATPVKPTPDEEVEMRQVEEREERGTFDRAIMKKWLDEKRHKERMHQLALKEAEAIKASNS